MSRQKDQKPTPAGPAAPTPASTRWPLFVVALLGVAVAGAGAWVWLSAQRAAPAQATAAAPRPAIAAAYVADTQCGDCHAKAAEAWRGSHHQRAMEVASAQTVLGDFANAKLAHKGATTLFTQRDGRYYITMEGRDGKPAEFEVKYTFGVAPLQQYLVEFPGGRLQAPTVAWDTEKKRWFALYPNDRHAPDDPLHSTGRYQNWNMMCSECHSTDLRRNYDAKADTYDTKWAEPSVGCQACHGPGSAHVAWAKAAAGKDDQGTRRADAGPRRRLPRQRLALSGRRVRAVPFATAAPHRCRAAGQAVPRQLPSGAAARGAVLRRRPAAGRGLRVGLVPAEQDVRAGRALHRLPRPARARPQGQGQRAVRAVPPAGRQRALSDAREEGLRLRSASPPSAGQPPAPVARTATCRRRTTW